MGNTHTFWVSRELDYSPFGMTLVGREWGVNNNTFGYQGSLVDNEIYSNNNSISTYFRENDSRIGRWWSVDPKAGANPNQSPYCSMDNNPIVKNDIRGDEIPTTMYDEEGNETNIIPQELQEMFNSEYGIVVGYNSDTKMLYQVDECDPDQNISMTAKGALEQELQVGCVSENALVFGYNLGVSANVSGKDVSGPIVGGLNISPIKTSYIDLADFDNGMWEDAQYGSTETSPFYTTRCIDDPRTFNLARVFEHEYIGHNIYGLSDEPKDNTGFNPGPCSIAVNKFSQEIGLDMRITYKSQWSAYNYKTKKSIDYGIQIYFAPEYMNYYDSAFYVVIQILQVIYF